MVGADGNNIAIVGNRHRIRRIYCRCSIYIHLILSSVKAATKNSKTDILVIVLGFTIIGLLSHKPVIIWLAVLAGVLALSSAVIEGWILFVWHKLAEIMGWVMSKILLGIVFYVFLLPLSLLKKMSGSKDALQLKAPENSVWVSRDHLYTSDDMSQPF